MNREKIFFRGDRGLCPGIPRFAGGFLRDVYEQWDTAFV